MSLELKDLACHQAIRVLGCGVCILDNGPTGDCKGWNGTDTRGAEDGWSMPGVDSPTRTTGTRGFVTGILRFL